MYNFLTSIYQGIIQLHKKHNKNKICLPNKLLPTEKYKYFLD